jgi:hypothetical protein
VERWVATACGAVVKSRERGAALRLEKAWFFLLQLTGDKDKHGGHVGLAVAGRHRGWRSQNGEKRRSGGNRPHARTVTGCRGARH